MAGAEWRAKGMRSKVMGMLVVVVAGALSNWTEAQVSAPAQPAAEVQVAQEFEKAAPILFREWLALRPDVLKRVGLGKRNRPNSRCLWVGYFEFMDCKDTAPPSTYKIDVTKTDSVLTPFVGHLYVPVKETCTVRNVVPKGMSWTEKNLSAIEANCVGKTYDECIAAGAKDAPKLMGSDCTGGPGFSFPFEDDVHLTYRWSQGKWEFQEEKSAKPAPPSGQR